MVLNDLKKDKIMFKIDTYMKYILVYEYNTGYTQICTCILLIWCSWSTMELQVENFAMIPAKIVTVWWTKITIRLNEDIKFQFIQCIQGEPGVIGQILTLYSLNLYKNFITAKQLQDILWAMQFCAFNQF